MHNDCSIRPARSDDTDAILSFIGTSTDQPEYLHEVWDAWLTDPRGPLLVAEVCGQPVATGKVTMLSATEAWLEGLSVHPAFQRRGLARRLINERLALARTAGARVARTFVFAANHVMLCITCWTKQAGSGCYGSSTRPPIRSRHCTIRPHYPLITSSAMLPIRRSHHCFNGLGAGTA